jgi:hypothetical protein
MFKQGAAGLNALISLNISDSAILPRRVSHLDLLNARKS